MPVHGATLSLIQDLDAHGIGGVVWDCGAALAALLDRCPALVQGRQVLDLGCGGSAIGGIAASHCGAEAVTLTDISEVAPRTACAAWRGLSLKRCESVVAGACRCR